MSVDRYQELRSETSRAELTIYPQGNDPILNTSADVIEFSGVRGDKNSSLINIQTSKTMGMAGGTFTAFVKESPTYAAEYKRLDDMIMDDDWVDIVFSRWGVPHHTMRGLIDDIRKGVTVDGSGATQQGWYISGREFSKVWEDTPVFFNRFTGENVGGGAYLKIFDMSPEIMGTPFQTVEVFLKYFLAEFHARGRSTWYLPPSMPAYGETFLEAITFLNNQGYPPDRRSFAFNIPDFQNNRLWALAQQYSDPQFCELFVDLLKDGTDYPEPMEPFEIGDGRMALIFRDRPFPTLFSSFGTDWEDLPLSIVKGQEITNDDTGRSGAERKNAFFAAPKYYQENAASMVDLSVPLWDEDDITLRGVRRLDYVSDYIPVDANLIGASEIQRGLIRDWYCLNPYFFNGTIGLGHLRPDLRIGTKVRVPGHSEDDDFTYYLEGVSHTWQLNSGRTQLSVTRGWRGTGLSYQKALETMAARYTEADE